MIEKYLQVSDSRKISVRNEVIRLLTVESIIPSFSEAALKLCILAQDENATLADFVKIISIDPGLATRSIKVAGTVGYAARPIDDITQAVSLIGIRKIRRIAFAVATIDTFAHFKVKIDWRRFWLHNVLVARLTDRVASAFRESSGMEYLAGLLHDVGKLMIEHYFPREFDAILLSAASRNCDHATVEREILGIDHTQIGAAVCHCLHVHTQVVQAVWHHHNPLEVNHASEPNSDGGFLAACISVADKLARTIIPYEGQSFVPKHPIEQTPEWLFLSQLAKPNAWHVDMREELKATEEDLQAFF